MIADEQTVPEIVKEFVGNFSSYQKEGMTQKQAMLAVFTDMSPIMFGREFDDLTMKDVNLGLDKQRKLFEWAIDARGNRVKSAAVRDGLGWGISVAKTKETSSLIIQLYPIAFVFTAYMLQATVIKPVNLNFGFDVGGFRNGSANLVFNLGVFAVAIGWRWKERLL